MRVDVGDQEILDDDVAGSFPCGVTSGVASSSLDFTDLRQGRIGPG